MIQILKACAGYLTYPQVFFCDASGMHDPPSFEFHDDKDMSRSKQPIINQGKVASPDVADMILHESRPGLARRRRLSFFWHVFLDGSFAHLDSQLEQFTPNPLRSS